MKSLTAQTLKKILVDSNLISNKDFNAAEKEAKESKTSLEDLIIDKGLIGDAELGQLMAEEIGFPFINLKKTKIEKQNLEIVPETMAKKQKIIVFGKTAEGFKIAMANPNDLETRESIERKTGEKAIPYFSTQKDILEALKFYKKDINEEFADLIGENLKSLKITGSAGSAPLPIIKIVDLLLNYGYENRSSDIHIEPYRDKSILRYRIDGVLHDVMTLQRPVHDYLVSRIKIMSKLRTDIHENSQDGHFSFQAENEKVDVRVSVVPIEEGEKIVMRLLAGGSKMFSFDDLGMEERDMVILQRNIKKPWGMILVSGPTGSGKTTTLYAALKILNRREVNICTIEDPIEYDIEGINQVQVNQKTNLTFSEGLKAIMRQNPDIIMVGEIRDIETAKLAVNAALTGHLVLSTFHAIDAGTSLTRLSDMEVEPFLITSCVNVVISQRLVRKICPQCIESYEVPLSDISKLLPKEFINMLPKTKEDKILLYRGKGCDLCQGTGYLGRLGIFEVLEMSESIKKMVIEKKDAYQIKEEGRKEGMSLMIEDGLRKVEKGVTTLEEVLRAVK
ncbi:MAG: type II/IV secretion system protein [Candidatus Parcubacteria bacterium]|nr:type II/IV secretion system protein [Candidatus Parcubacteria bacterium]